MFTSCDRCGPTVRATIIAVNGTQELAWCGHHARTNKDELEHAGFTLIELTNERQPAWTTTTGATNSAA